MQTEAHLDMQLHAAKTARVGKGEGVGGLAIIDCPALLEASSGADHKLEGLFLRWPQRP